MTLAQLATLESSGLVALTSVEPELEYIFRHVLIQDAVYDSLLKSEQHSLHRTAGEVLEQLYGDRREELASRLAEHFWLAGDPQRALPYFLMAARRASRTYANAEAVENYGRALQAAEDNPAAQIEILQARGNLFDLMGKFEQARADLETALKLAETHANRRAEWQSLLDLGLLWASQDYQQTGAYYQRALSLARQLSDNRILAYSLNRVGNYSINQERPDESRLNHEEALLIFKQLNDQQGMAETEDLLGMSTLLGGDSVTSANYFRQAIARFEQMGNLRSLSSCLTSLAMMTNEYQTDTMVSTRLTSREGIQLAQRAYQLARDIGWRSGEIFCLCNLTLCMAAHGDYDPAIASIELGASIGEQIKHRQWAVFIAMVTGTLYMDINQLSKAQAILEQGLVLALQNHSTHWTHTSCGQLALVLIRAGDLPGAEAVLNQYLPPDTPARTMGQRLAWAARAELALARADPQAALEIIQRLLADGVFLTQEGVSVRVWQLRGEALTALAEQTRPGDEKQILYHQAEESLQAALKEAVLTEYHSKIWRIHLALARLYQSQGRDAEARKEHQTAKSLVQKLSRAFSDEGMRRAFLQQALAIRI